MPSHICIIGKIARDLNKIVSVGGQITSAAVCCNKIRDGSVFAKTATVNGMGKVVVHDVSSENKGSVVTKQKPAT